MIHLDWLIFSLLTALAVAFRDVSVKKMAARLTTYEIVALELTWALPLLFAGLFFIHFPAEIKPPFWPLFIISLPLNAVAYLLYAWAITHAQLSLTLPLLSLTPVFMVITGKLVLNESVSNWGIAGIVLVSAGSYLLHYDKRKLGLLEPLWAILRDKGSLAMFVVAFLFSFAGVIGKKAMLASSALFFNYSFFFTFNILLVALLLLFKKCPSQTLIKQGKKGIWLGCLLFAHLSFHGVAIVLTKAAYMISIKRCSILFALLLGWYFYREERIRSRIIGALLMFCGATIITLLGR